MPRDRSGEFSTALFERYARSEKAPVAALAEMYVQGVSTRKVKAITEELCGHSFSASSISAINKGLDKALAKFANRPLDESYPYLILDARYERVQDNGVIAHQAVLIAIGINWEGNITETLTFCRLPRAHHKHLKSTNMLERLNEEIKRRTLAGLVLSPNCRIIW